MDLVVLQRDSDIMTRCWDAIEKGELPTDEDLLLFHWKGVRWLDCTSWNGIDALLTIDRKNHYPIRGIKDCLIIDECKEGVVRKKQGTVKTRVPRKTSSTDTKGKVPV